MHAHRLETIHNDEQQGVYTKANRTGRMNLKKPHFPTGFVVAISLALGLGEAPGAIIGLQGLPARDSGYQNVQILTDAPPEQMQQIMEAISVSLGVGCEYCHDPADPASDANPHKVTARQMIQMVISSSESYFEILEPPSCWTCHRGSPTPETESAIAPDPVSRATGGAPFSTEDRLSREVYGNIQNYGDLPASGLRRIMEAYSFDLGVGCDYCHIESDWANDAKLMKLLARRMFDIQEGLIRDYLSSDSVVSCWTCHRGNALPETSLPAEILPGPG